MMDRVHRVIMRLDREFMGNYDIVSRENDELQIQFLYKGVVLHVSLGNQYPFSPPKIDEWHHSRFYIVAPYIEQYYIRGFIGKKCLYCSVYHDWSPSKKISSVVEKFIEIDTFISNCVKLNFIYVNKLNLIEDVLPIIFSYLSDRL